jgi:glycyl-tRNA synthetase beta subunit
MRKSNYRSLHAAVPELKAMTKNERLKSVENNMRRMRTIMAIASEILALDKQELIENVSAKLDLFGPSLMEFADAGEDARGLLI